MSQTFHITHVHTLREGNEIVCIKLLRARHINKCSFFAPFCLSFFFFFYSHTSFLAFPFLFHGLDYFSAPSPYPVSHSDRVMMCHQKGTEWGESSKDCIGLCPWPFNLHDSLAWV